MEIIRNRELALNKGNYSSKFSLDSHAKDLISWWVHNVDLQSKSLCPSSPSVELYTDACLTGRGASMNDVKMGGHWAQKGLDHINVLKLKAILLGLSSLCQDCKDTHIRLRSDNSTAVACIDRFRSTKP